MKRSQPHRRDSMLQVILDHPDAALVALHQLTGSADHNAAAATLLGGLPGLLELAGENLMARLAEAYQTLFRSQSEPALTRPGVYKMRETLATPEASALHGREEAHRLYDLCGQAMDAQTIGEIADLHAGLKSAGSPDSAPARQVTGAIARLQDLRKITPDHEEQRASSPLSVWENA